jgi:diguanylate cyclase (GGDEF)-like protein
VRALRTGPDVRGTALDAAITLGGADGAYLVELETDPDGEPLVGAALVVTACRGRVGRGAVGTRIPLDTTAACVDVFRAGQPLFLADPAEQAVASPSLLALSGARSLLFQPVGLHGAVLGVLAVAWDERLASVADHRAATVALLADETAVALDTEAMMLRLEVRSTTDALTGLPNRRAWDQTLPVLLDSARRTGTPLTVAVAALDPPRRYDDTLGHRAGDDLLRRFAGHCTGAVRDPDLVARWGGEEFTLALPACSVEHATRVLERVRTDVPDGQTCSVGFAVWDGAEGPAELLARADAALYRARSLGRDTLCGAGPATPEVS